ncbi:MAG: nucleoside kinase [Tissierellia bacterium]|nr:nucleoside kinase [Tissierellia bacterium]
MNYKIFDKNYETIKDITIKEAIFNEKIGGNYIAAIIDGEIVSLNNKIKDNDKINLIDRYSDIGNSIYVDTLSLIFILATKKVFRDKNIRVNLEFSIGNGLYTTIENSNITHECIKEIQDEMYNIINRDIPIEKEVVSDKVAKSLFEAEEYYEKIDLLESLNKKQVEIAIVDGKVFTFDNILAPSTSYIDKFKIISYYPGIVIMYPDINTKQISKFEEQANISKVFSVSRKWTESLGVRFAGNLNQYVNNNSMDYLIDVNESYYNIQLYKCANIIASQDDLKIILISGPSSSGKTTTANRLKIELGVYGKKPVIISTDDYFLDRDKTPINDKGYKDFENIDAIDIEKLNKDLLLLLEGKEVELPKFNFVTGKSEPSGRKIKLDHKYPLIIEGIHSLNPRLSSGIPEKNKFKIYVSALTQVNIDSHNRIRTSDSRLIRRIVRDQNFRGYSPEYTLKVWQNVRDGEEKYIFPFQENADFYIDTSLVYEFNALKHEAIEDLSKIEKTSKFYPKARRLISLLNNFISLKDKNMIPKNSILREFIGGDI